MKDCHYGVQIPPSCCWCNASGRCKNCRCVKDGQPCTNCLPSRRGTCSNRSTSTVNQLAEQIRPTPPPSECGGVKERAATSNLLNIDQTVQIPPLLGTRRIQKHLHQHTPTHEHTCKKNTLTRSPRHNGLHSSS